MDDDNVFISTGVKFTDRELGRGRYGRVFAVDYNGVTCAAKEVHPILYNTASSEERSRIKRMFLYGCRLHSKLHHPNIVKMLGVCYPNDQAVLPVLVMELMECNLTQQLRNHQNIPMHIKLSILKDISRAICYLHTLKPPVMHRDLNSNNILLTTSLVAKVCDFGVMKVVLPLSSYGMTHAQAQPVDFMPPEVFEYDYGLPLDVFSFGCVICHVITQQWPIPLPSVIKDPQTNKYVTLSEVKRRQYYIDQISEWSLKKLVITCLDDRPGRRPPISDVSERIAG